MTIKLIKSTKRMISITGTVIKVGCTGSTEVTTLFSSNCHNPSPLTFPLVFLDLGIKQRKVEIKYFSVSFFLFIFSTSEALIGGYGRYRRVPCETTEKGPQVRLNQEALCRHQSVTKYFIGERCSSTARWTQPVCGAAWPSRAPSVM